MSVLEIVLLVLALNLALLSLYLNHQLQVRKAQLRLVRESRWQTAQALHSVQARLAQALHSVQAQDSAQAQAQARLAQAQDSARQADHNATLRSRPN